MTHPTPPQQPADELREQIDNALLEAVNAAITYRESGLIDQSAYETFMNNHIEVTTAKLVAQVERQVLEARIDEWQRLSEQYLPADIKVYRQHRIATLQQQLNGGKHE